jgi:hypothetical protein
MPWFEYDKKCFWAGEHRILGVLMFETSVSIIDPPDTVLLYVVTANQYRLFDRDTVRGKFLSRTQFNEKHPDLKTDFHTWIHSSSLIPANPSAPESRESRESEQDQCIHEECYCTEDWGYNPSSYGTVKVGEFHVQIYPLYES